MMKMKEGIEDGVRVRRLLFLEHGQRRWGVGRPGSIRSMEDGVHFILSLLCF